MATNQASTLPALPTAVKLCDKKAASSPAVLNNQVWFQGDDEKIWRVSVEGTGEALNPHGLKCRSAPTASIDGRVYFQGDAWGSSTVMIAMEERTPWLYTALTAPCMAQPVLADDGSIYIPGPNSLIRAPTRQRPEEGVRLSAETPPHMLAIGPVGATRRAYFGFNPDNLYSYRLDNVQPTFNWNKGVQIIDAPVFGRDGKLHVVTTGNEYVEIDPVSLNIVTDNIMPFCATTPIESQTYDDGNLYWTSSNNEVFKTLKSDLTQKKQLGYGLGRPCVPGDGHAYFRGTDSYLYRVEIPA